VQFGRERDGFALSQVELDLNEVAAGSNDFHPRRRITGPTLHRFRRRGVLEFLQYGRRNQNSCV
jgi:hypothetical protein